MPLEAIRRILENSLPRDLLNLISASPGCFQVYASAPTHYLLHAAKLAVPAPLWSEFCAAYSSTAGFRIFEYQDQMYSDAVWMQGFIDDFFDNVQSFECVVGEHNIRAALSTFCKIDYFVQDFVKKAAKEARFLQRTRTDSITPGSYRVYNFTRQGPVARRFAQFAYGLPSRFEDADGDSMEDTSSLEFKVSNTELVRLYRAFFRFEIYCNLFRPVESYEREKVYTDDEQFSLFLIRLKPWAVEEMSVVHQYLSEIVETALESVDKDFEAHVRHVATKEARRDRSDRALKAERRRESYDLRIFRSPLYMFSTKFRRDVTAATRSMTAIGLPSLYRLARSDTHERLELLRDTNPDQFQFLKEMPSGRPAELDLPPEDLESGSVDDNDDDTNQPNLGYTNYTRADAKAYLTEDEGHFPFRAVGYVFWDAQRIRGALLRDALAEAGRMSTEFVRRRYGYRRRQSAQLKVQNLRMSRDAMDCIAERFGAWEYLNQWQDRVKQDGTSDSESGCQWWECADPCNYSEIG